MTRTLIVIGVLGLATSASAARSGLQGLVYPHRTLAAGRLSARCR